jgi:hypothetical protein
MSNENAPGTWKFVPELVATPTQQRRAELAAQAMLGLLAGALAGTAPRDWEQYLPDKAEIARHAADYADHLLAELAKPQGEQP